ncbi:MAG: 30S ribosomal protein S6 [Defluviitaleaceae bacterium]|nr:30S ribosomal protein S6 [Defluviitaleaceae bacterium]
MHKYELGIVLHPALDEEGIKTESDAILELIARFGGVIEKADVWGRRKLAYEINKLTEGHYTFYYIDAPATMPAELEDRLNIRENVIRYLTIRREDLEKQ